MRLQLFLGFALVIIVGMVASWFMAVRTTDAEFDVLVSDTNHQRAELTAPSLLAEYETQRNWEAVQANLAEQLNQQARMTAMLPNLSLEIQTDGVSTITFGTANLHESWSDDFSFSLDFLDQFFREEEEIIEEWIAPPSVPLNEANMYVIQPHKRRFEEKYHPYANPFIVQPADIGFTVASIAAANQRGIVADENGEVVVDTSNELLGKKVDEIFLSKGVPLYRNGTQIGTFLITSQDGVYTFEQYSFIQEVRQGYVIGGAVSTLLALVVALLLSHQLSRPIHSLTAAASRIQDGEWGYQVNFRARSEIGKLGRAFNEMSRHLSEQRHLRAQLVDDLAHELKTPLTLMRLELQGMKDGLQSPGEAAEHLNQELEEVSELVSDLIFLASRDTAPTPQMDWIDLNTVAASAVRRFEGSASDGRMLKFTPTDQLPPIYGDAYLVQRAVSNLISNAIRYTPRGGEIALRTAVEGEKVQVIVQDTGEGIPSEHLPHIFERFYRVDGSRSRHSGGRGLGLAIVKQIMQQHQGQVLVESQVGKGSTFKLVWSVA